jgi:hypothetical protein
MEKQVTQEGEEGREGQRRTGEETVVVMFSCLLV